MNTKRFSNAIALCLMLGVVAVLANAVFASWEAEKPMPAPLKLERTEFSTDGGASWQAVGDGASLRRHRGDVSIRGHFNMDFEDKWFLNLHLQHMQMEVFINGEKSRSFATEFREIRPEWCADLWVNLGFPPTTTDDLIEFRFHTLHPFGVDSGAYEKLLSSMTVGHSFFFYQVIHAQRAPGQIFGLVLMIVGFVLLGITCAAFWMNSPLQKPMMFTALLAVGEGLFWLAGASEIAHYVNGSIAFFNTGRAVSRMLTIFALLFCLADAVSDKTKIWARRIACTSAVISSVFLVLELLGATAFCAVEWIWQLLQLLCLLAGFGLCLHEQIRMHPSLWSSIRLLSLNLAQLSLMLDILNRFFGWYPETELSKYVCGAVALGQAAALLVQLPASYAAIQRAEKLSEELHHSRIVLAMSQIRTHFIFNVLNAISSLCKSEPELADQELVRFSRYLRNNIDIMQEDRPIPFEKALEHMHNYVDLEQLRFDEKILLDENYEYTDFMIPSLVIQPLVENAIKHGLLPKEEGGVIRVSTQRCGDEVMIEIADNGVGFDTQKKIAQTSVGLSNVRFRVERMMNGRMKLESTPGKGTVVRVWLPAGKEDGSCTLSM